MPEHRIEEAIGLLAEVEKTVAEGAGAAGLAALLHQPARFAGRRVGIIVSGGNIDPRLLSSVLLRSLVRQGRLTHMRVETDDLPGQLAAIAAIMGASGGNLIEVTHQRLLSAVPLRRVDVDLLVETRDAAHLDAHPRRPGRGRPRRHDDRALTAAEAPAQPRDHDAKP